MSKSPWYTFIVEIEQFHRLMTSEFGEAEIGRPYKNRVKKKGWSINDTAEELGISPPIVSQALELAEAIKNKPELKDLKNKAEALRMIKL